MDHPITLDDIRNANELRQGLKAARRKQAMEMAMKELPRERVRLVEWIASREGMSPSTYELNTNGPHRHIVAAQLADELNALVDGSAELRFGANILVYIATLPRPQ